MLALTPDKLKSFAEYRSFLLTYNNGFSFGFKNQVLLSDKEPTEHLFPEKDRSYISLIPYDHKNKIERFNKPAIETAKLVEVESHLSVESLPSFSMRHEKPGKVSKAVSKQDYLRHVNELKEHIQQGDIYEINYCIPFIYEDISLDPFVLYNRLNSISQAPFSSLSKFEDVYIISSSPERFLKKTGDKLITQPIKGTAKRSSDENEDGILKSDLLQSLKERTENIMIVDVARNDLSRIAARGSVHVERLYDIQSYRQVHQMVSTISCTVKKETNYNDIIRATFPMASMTGAPKIRAMQLIDDAEELTRGFYSGALGYIEENGDFDSSVLIRSIFCNSKNRTACFWVGSAITSLSDPEKEYEECMLKARAMKEVLENF
jgi:para-aminobenzoate synthetase component 1